MPKQRHVKREQFKTPYPIRKVGGVWYKMTQYGAIDKPMTAPMRKARGVENDNEA